MKKVKILGTPFVFAIILAVLLSASCTPQSQLVYMQDKSNRGDIIPAEPRAYRLKPGDILHVRIMSADPESYDVFNLDDTRRFTSTGGDAGNQQMFLYGYTVSPRGEIQVPVIGAIGVAGKTLDEAHDVILEMAEEYLVDATVAVKIVNFSVTVLGEVRRPGNFYVYDHEFSLMDAIGMAGDLTDYGNRSVQVLRQTDQGVVFDRIDITDRRAIESELYFLQPNDVVYVEPLISKRFGFAQFPWGVVFSGISTALLLINFF